MQELLLLEQALLRLVLRLPEQKHQGSGLRALRCQPVRQVLLHQVPEQPELWNQALQEQAQKPQEQRHPEPEPGPVSPCPA
ncbi:hypothetical protein AA0482_0445 [Acetobacter cibinongensis NRIC 0482]|nr:hypothetical protein AA0482_0445 [Acetobacter cibinongensis NRIC 0482]